MKRIASATIVGAILVLAPVGVAGTASAAPSYYSSCTAAFAAGRSDIPVGDPEYRKGLDRDGDGLACEREEGSGSGVNSGNSNEDESTSSESSQNSSDEDSDSSTDDQVEVVPTGGAETGDGSTTGHAGWWLGGGLLAGLAGLLTARRVRSGADSRV